MELILLALASFMVWMAAYPLIPFPLPDRIAPFLVGGIATGLWYVPWHPAILILAASAGVLLLHRLVAVTGIVMPEPLRLRMPHLPRKTRVITLGEESYVPGQAPSHIGKRIKPL